MILSGSVLPLGNLFTDIIKPAQSDLIGSVTDAIKPAAGGIGKSIIDFFAPAKKEDDMLGLSALLPALGSAAKAGAAGIGGFLTDLATPAAGLTEAFAKGLGSIGLGKSTPMQITQSQTVGQSTTVNVSNVLGGQPFGNVDESGNFDTFQALADVFAIRDAMTAQTEATGGQQTTIPTTSGSTINPLIFVGLAVGGIILLMRK